MLNLSDKELDRLSREAASEHDPGGSMLSPGAWDKLEWRLDRELGKAGSPMPSPGIRRIPYFYAAPAILLLAGISYYIIKTEKSHTRSPLSASPVIRNPESSGSPPPAIDKAGKHGNATTDLSPKSSDYSYNSTSKDSTVTLHKDDLSRLSHGQGSVLADHDRNPGSAMPAGAAGAAQGSVPIGTTPGSALSGTAPGSVSTGTAPGGTSTGLSSPGSATSHSGSLAANDKRPKTGEQNHAGQNHTGQSVAGTSVDGTQLSAGSVTPPGHSLLTPGGNAQASGHRPQSIEGSPQSPGGSTQTPGSSLQTRGSNSQVPGNSPQTPAPGAETPREAAWSIVRPPVSLTKPPSVSDSALRAFTAIEGPIHPDKKNNHSLHVNRNLQLGLLMAPDFASVNSLAGEKPGSSFGLTIDYQFANRWYISSGLLFTKKNYTARAQDFHAPTGFYQANNMYDVNFVKGALTMLEIPLNIRYDFSISNNTIFFVSGGTSSYLRTNESCNYYFPYFGGEASRPFKYTPNANYLFSAINLSFGVEAGISNSLALLIAPYMKFPTGGSGIGFGQIQISSVGINFGVKYAPVLSRKRK